MQNTFSQSGNDSKWFLTKIIFQNSLMANETPSRPPPSFMANAILNFHFDFLNPSLTIIYSWTSDLSFPPHSHQLSTPISLFPYINKTFMIVSICITNPGWYLLYCLSCSLVRSPAKAASRAIVSKQICHFFKGVFVLSSIDECWEKININDFLDCFKTGVSTASPCCTFPKFIDYAYEDNLLEGRVVVF